MATLNTKEYIQPLKEAFIALADSERAAAMSKYMLHHFTFYGVMTIDRRNALKEFIKSSPKVNAEDAIAVAMEMWNQTEREFHYCAIEFLDAYKKHFKKEFIDVIEKLIAEHSWWDSVDHVNSRLLKYHFLKYPELIEPYTTKWNESNNMWLQRISIIFQIKWKDKTDTKRLAKHIIHCKHSKEFFIRKAIGWALREYSAVNSNWVMNFVEQEELVGLSRREALRNINL